MPKLYGSLNAGLGTLPIQPGDAGKGVNAPVRVHREVITLASQATTDTIVIGRLPSGHQFLYGVLCTTVTLGSATIAIGITGATGKYRAAATFTAVDTPTLFGVAAAVGAASPLAADEEVFITIATAALPASGTLTTLLFTSKP
jgi:hypothetical protein